MRRISRTPAGLIIPSFSPFMFAPGRSLRGADLGLGRGMFGGGSPKSGGGGAPTYLLTEDCDSGQNGWTTLAGTPNYAATPSLDGGTNCFSLPGKTNAAATTIYKSFTPTATQQQEAYFQFKWTDGPSGAAAGKTLAYFSTGTTQRAVLSLYWDGTDVHLRVTPNGGTAATTVSTLAVNTLYHVWFYYKTDGVNAVARGEFSADGTKTGSGNGYVESTDGTGTVDANRLYLRGEYSSSQGFDVLIDHVRVDDADIGSSPP